MLDLLSNRTQSYAEPSPEKTGSSTPENVSGSNNVQVPGVLGDQLTQAVSPGATTPPAAPGGAKDSAGPVDVGTGAKGGTSAAGAAGAAGVSSTAGGAAPVTAPPKVQQAWLKWTPAEETAFFTALKRDGAGGKSGGSAKSGGAASDKELKAQHNRWAVRAHVRACAWNCARVVVAMIDCVAFRPAVPRSYHVRIPPTEHTQHTRAYTHTTHTHTTHTHTLVDSRISARKLAAAARSRSGSTTTASFRR
jgi:hypothetical protein